MGPQLGCDDPFIVFGGQWMRLGYHQWESYILTSCTSHMDKGSGQCAQREAPENSLCTLGTNGPLAAGDGIS